jgi:hypothetical protein
VEKRVVCVQLIVIIVGGGRRRSSGGRGAAASVARGAVDIIESHVKLVGVQIHVERI